MRSRNNKEVRRSIWKNDNSLEKFRKIYPTSTDEWIKKNLIRPNNKLAKFLIENGWEYWESYLTVEEEHGYTHSFAKKVDGPLYLRFKWFLDSMFCDYFQVGSLHAHFDYYPKDKYWHPIGFMEISPILKRHLPELKNFETQIVTAMKSQKPLE